MSLCNNFFQTVYSINVWADLNLLASFRNDREIEKKMLQRMTDKASCTSANFFTHIQLIKQLLTLPWFSDLIYEDSITPVVATNPLTLFSHLKWFKNIKFPLIFFARRKCTYSIYSNYPRNKVFQLKCIDARKHLKRWNNTFWRLNTIGRILSMNARWLESFDTRVQIHTTRGLPSMIDALICF